MRYTIVIMIIYHANRLHVDAACACTYTASLQIFLLLSRLACTTETLPLYVQPCLLRSSSSDQGICHSLEGEALILTPCKPTSSNGPAASVWTSRELRGLRGLDDVRRTGKLRSGESGSDISPRGCRDLELELRTVRMSVQLQYLHAHLLLYLHVGVSVAHSYGHSCSLSSSITSSLPFRFSAVTANYRPTRDCRLWPEW
ncbi:hypothetical protein GGR52DRAFT_321701 [Hypoxylon sp. FL1284]|nr:hypothetical protein GGR52DRAFT_321701 [Hypoxylon sp. FL1284]